MQSPVALKGGGWGEEVVLQLIRELPPILTFPIKGEGTISPAWQSSWSCIQGKRILISTPVTPAKAGGQGIPARYNLFYREGLLDSDLRRKDGYRSCLNLECVCPGLGSDSLTPLWGYARLKLERPGKTG